jgi:hypothetical protein
MVEGIALQMLTRVVGQEALITFILNLKLLWLRLPLAILALVQWMEVQLDQFSANQWYS